MVQVRVIPCLLLKGKGLVKTVQFKDPKYIGDPINAVKIFNEKEVDELIFLDITATVEGRGPQYELIRSIASEAFIPFAYGGGIKTIEEMHKLFKIGVEKVIINTAVLDDHQLIKKAAAEFGSQSIVVAVDVKKNLFGKYQIYSHSGTKKYNKDLYEYIKEIESFGCGELFINSIDRDGMMQGLDLELIKYLSSQISIPLIACGGAGTLEDIKRAFDNGASAVGCGSMFVYHGPLRGVLINYPKKEDLESFNN